MLIETVLWIWGMLWVVHTIWLSVIYIYEQSKENNDEDSKLHWIPILAIVPLTWPMMWLMTADYIFFGRLGGKLC